MDMRDDFYKGSVMWQLEKVNAERAIAVKALQEIEEYLRCAEPLEELVLSYGVAVAALIELNEEE